MKQTTREMGFHECSAKFLYQVPLKQKTNYYALFFSKESSFSSSHDRDLQHKYIQHFYPDDAVLMTNKCLASLKTATP
jgi:hypothetical protein